MYGYQKDINCHDEIGLNAEIIYNTILGSTSNKIGRTYVISLKKSKVKNDCFDFLKLLHLNIDSKTWIENLYDSYLPTKYDNLLANAMAKNVCGVGSTHNIVNIYGVNVYKCHSRGPLCKFTHLYWLLECHSNLRPHAPYLPPIEGFTVPMQWSLQTYFTNYCLLGFSPFTWEVLRNIANYKRKTWLLDRISNLLIRLAIANREDCHFKFHNNQSWDVRVIGAQSMLNVRFLFSLSNHIDPCNCVSYWS